MFEHVMYFLIIFDQFKFKSHFNLNQINKLMENESIKIYIVFYSINMLVYILILSENEKKINFSEFTCIINP